jgi:hypothetical protein
MATTAIIMLLGIFLVGDGAGALNAASRATALAKEAARASGQQIDPAQAITGTAIVVDPDEATAAARAYLRAEGLDGEIDISPDGARITVTVTVDYDTRFASIVGVSTIPVTGSGHARLIHTLGS